MKITLSKAFVFAIIVLFIGAGFVSSISSDEPIFGITLYVGGSGTGNYTTIQSAIDNANSGDTVYVYNGIYYENVVVDKTINLTGEDRNTTIIDGGGSVDVVYVNADDVNVQGFKILNSGEINDSTSNSIWFIRGLFRYLDDDEEYISVSYTHLTLPTSDLV